MSVLSRTEIDELLQIKSPEEIRSSEAVRLDQDGLAYLRERETSPGIEDFLRESARHTKKRIDAASENELGNIIGSSKRKQTLGSWFKGATPIRNPAIVFVLALFAFAVLFIGAPDKIGVSETRDVETIKRLKNEPGAEEADKELFEALKKRGIHFFEEAERQNKPEYYEEAVIDLSQALGLRRDREVQRFLILALERLDIE
jgi:hypothetical protein